MRIVIDTTEEYAPAFREMAKAVGAKLTIEKSQGLLGQIEEGLKEVQAKKNGKTKGYSVAEAVAIAKGDKSG